MVELPPEDELHLIQKLDYVQREFLEEGGQPLEPVGITLDTRDVLPLELVPAEDCELEISVEGLEADAQDEGWRQFLREARKYSRRLRENGRIE